LADALPDEVVVSHVETVRAVIANCVQAMPTHEALIARHFAAPPMGKPMKVVS
jgi:tryptophan halogenase